MTAVLFVSTFVFSSYVCRPARVWHSEEPWGERVPDQNAILLRGESSGAAAVAMAPVDGVQLSLWLRADLRCGSKWEVAYKCQKDFYQRQVWGQRGESVWFLGPDPSASLHITSHGDSISQALYSSVCRLVRLWDILLAGSVCILLVGLYLHC